jgi:hypothetical protein
MSVPKQDILTLPVTLKAPAPQSASKSQQSRQRFLSVWPRIRGELEDVMVKHNMPKDSQEWFKNVCIQLITIRLGVPATFG